MTYPQCHHKNPKTAEKTPTLRQNGHPPPRSNAPITPIYMYMHTYIHTYIHTGVLLCPCHALLGNSRFCSLAGFEGTATRTVFKFNMAAQSEVGLYIYDGEDINMGDPGMTDADMLSDGQSAQALLLTPVGGTSRFDHDTIKLSIHAILQRMTQAQEGLKKMQECDYS